MKKLKAFTMLEAIVTVIIVGIVAALTLPTLSKNINNEINCSQLGKNINLIQNGIAEMMQYAQNKSEDATAIQNLGAIQVKDLFTNPPEGESLNSYMADGQRLFSITGGFLNVSEAINYDINAITDYSGNPVDENILSDCQTYQFNKNKAVIIFQSISNVVENTDDNDVITRILIDTNGNATPNRIGNDIFLFGLTNSGHMVPAGSDAYNNNIFGENINSYKEDCQNGEINTGLSCSARVIADNWKIKY